MSARLACPALSRVAVASAASPTCTSTRSTPTAPPGSRASSITSSTAPRSTSWPSPTTSGSTARCARPRSTRRASTRSTSSSARRSPRGAATSWRLFLTERVPALRPLGETLRAIHAQGGIAIAAHPLAPVPLSVGSRSLRRVRDDATADVHFDAIELFNPSTAGKTRHGARLALNARELGLPGVGNSDAHVLEGIGTGRTMFPGSTAADYRTAIAAGEVAARRRRVLVVDPQRRRVPPPAASQGAPPVAHGPARRRRMAVTSPAAPPSGILGRVSTGAGEAGSGARPPLCIGIVSPYGYPHPGGVNEHVRFTYEAMVRMGHDVWIITSKYGRERESEGHILRLGTGWAAPANGSVGRVTLGLRFKQQAREILEEHRFDILHFHEPLVPFLSPTMLDASETVNIGTFHAFGGFSPFLLDRRADSRAAWRTSSTAESRSRGAATPLHQPLLSRRLPDHPERRRPRPIHQTRRAIRGAARRHAEHPVRRPLRGAQGPDPPAPGLPPPAQAQGRRAAAGHR